LSFDMVGAGWAFKLRGLLSPNGLIPSTYDMDATF
jgi:hypothetical protein